MPRTIALVLLVAALSIPTLVFANDARQRSQSLDFCMRKASLTNHAPSGNVVIGLEIDEFGKVENATIHSSTVNNDELAECSLRMIRRWTFPAHGMSWNTSYTVVYSGNEQQARLP